MEIIPAIDIRGGRCVRLVQGDYSRETVYSEDPVAVAREWRDRGATRLHLVDLDGAREGRPVNRSVIVAIARAAGIPAQVGGGVRTPLTASAYIESGLDRVIVGTAAIEDAPFLKRLVEDLGDALVVGVDARGGRVMTRGWLQAADVSVLELAPALRDLGVGRFVYTDIERDGMLMGPNIAALVAFIEVAQCPVIASGGVASVDHVRAVRDTGAEGAIIGKALYDGTLQLEHTLTLLGAGA